MGLRVMIFFEFFLFDFDLFRLIKLSITDAHYLTNHIFFNLFRDFVNINKGLGIFFGLILFGRLRTLIRAIFVRHINRIFKNQRAFSLHQMILEIFLFFLIWSFFFNHNFAILAKPRPIRHATERWIQTIVMISLITAVAKK